MIRKDVHVFNRSTLTKNLYKMLHIWIITHIARVCIDRVRLPILLVVS